MNRKNLVLAAAAAALLTGQAYAGDVANWSPDAGAADAFPALVQPQGAGKTRAEVRAELSANRAVQTATLQWSPDGAVADAFPAERVVNTTGGRSRDAVRAEAAHSVVAGNVLDSREGA